MKKSFYIKIAIIVFVILVSVVTSTVMSTANKVPSETEFRTNAIITGYVVKSSIIPKSNDMELEIELSDGSYMLHASSRFLSNIKANEIINIIREDSMDNKYYRYRYNGLYLEKKVGFLFFKSEVNIFKY